MSFLRRNNDQPQAPTARNGDAQYEANRAALLGTGGGYQVSSATFTLMKMLINSRIVATMSPLVLVLNVHPAIMVTNDTAAVIPTATVTATLDLRMRMLVTRLPTS
jgi:adenosine deaminase